MKSSISQQIAREGQKIVQALQTIKKLSRVLNGSGTKSAKVAANRPSIRQVVRSIIRQSGPTTATEIYNKACEKHGKWSRHSLYRVLHDTREFKLVDDKYTITQHATKVAAKTSVKKVAKTEKAEKAA